MANVNDELATLADPLRNRRDALLSAWQGAIRRDPNLTGGDALPRAELLDHIPALLYAFEQSLRHVANEALAEAAGSTPAASHGLQRWLQGYDLREVTRELGKLNGCIIFELDAYASAHAQVSSEALIRARQAWATLCCSAIEESVNQYFSLQQQEAEGQVKDLEKALEEIRALERQRGNLWREAAHDLRGSVNVISTAAAALNRDDIPDPTRSEFSHILRKGIVSLHEFLSDLMSLARLEAGHDRRNVAAFDAGLLMREFCDAMRPLAAERGLFLKADGPESLLTEGDAAKVRRIAQNLVLNALHATERGGVSVTWQEGAPGLEQWMLCVQDSGPGFKSDSAPPLLRALKEATDEAHGVEERAEIAGDPSANTTPMPALASQSPARAPHDLQGEGIGLSIVKRLCELLDASLELDSATGKGTTVRVVFPRAYAK